MKSLPFLLLFLLAACASQPLENGQHTDCEVAIVGGGPAGTYLAYRLSAQYGNHLCLFEKESRLGGRMTDEQFGDIWLGTGARRVNEVQEYVKKLAHELGIVLQTPEKRSQLIHTAKRVGYSPDDFVQDFPGLIGPLDKDPGTTREDEIYQLLIDKKATAGQYPDLLSYISAVAGKNAAAFLRVASRFHADFDYPISAANYMDYMTEEFKLSGVTHYPVGGMNVFLQRMAMRIQKNGARIFLAEPVLKFEESRLGYALKTPSYLVQARRVVFAVPPTGFDHIGGKLAEEIRSKTEYKALLPVPVVVINQQWPNAWWAKAKKNPAAKGNAGRVWRAWSNAQCVNHVEIPQEAYLASAKATRSVYTDDPACIQHFRELHKEGIEAVEADVVKGLGNLFQVPVPKPLLTTMKYWPAAWYFVRAGAKVSNKEVAKWSQEPLPGRKNLMLVGESYWLDRPGWSEGGYFSADALIRARFAASE